MKILTPLIEMFILSALPITDCRCFLVAALEMADDPYQTVAAGSLKLKSTLKKKKKKKSKKETKERMERHLREESRSSPLTKLDDSDSEEDGPR